MTDVSKPKRKPDLVYSLKPSKPGRGVFSDVRLPDGTIIRRVDQAVHERALKAAAKRFKEKYG